MHLLCQLVLTLSVSVVVPVMSKGIKIFSGNANPALAAEIAKHLDLRLGNITVGRFSDGEVNVQVNEHIRGKDVYLVQPTLPPVNESLMELLLMISTMRRASARKITAVIPYYGYARQDRKLQARVPISAADVARLLEAMGVDRVVSVDLHCGQIQVSPVLSSTEASGTSAAGAQPQMILRFALARQLCCCQYCARHMLVMFMCLNSARLFHMQGFFRPRVPVDNLEGFTVGVTYFGDMDDLVNPTVVSPDAGGVYRCAACGCVLCDCVRLCMPVLWLLTPVGTRNRQNRLRKRRISAELIHRMLFCILRLPSEPTCI
jgi:hypothetical protein